MWNILNYNNGRKQDISPVPGKIMRKNYHSDAIKRALSKSRYKEWLERLPVSFFLAEYEVGELLYSTDEDLHLLQIVVSGALSVYYVRDDGSRYSLAVSEKDDLFGEIEFFGGGRNENIISEVTKKLTTLAFSTKDNRETLLKNADLLRVLGEALAKTIGLITMQNAAQPSLKERVYSYMVYKCNRHTFKGIEKAAFELHCSARQLQRIMNAFEEEGIVKKTGKGMYELV